MATLESLQTMSDQSSVKPWYRQRWLWFVLSIPIASVILSSIMIFFAVSGKDSLVNDNYYKDGLAINQTIEQDQLAKKLDLLPVISIAENGEILVQEEALKTGKEPFLILKLVHPTIGDFDQEIRLLPSANGYVGNLESNAPEGRWYLSLLAHDARWRIREELVFPVSQHTLNLP